MPGTLDNQPLVNHRHAFNRKKKIFRQPPIYQADQGGYHVLGGTLADRLFEPLMAETGFLAATVDSIIGTGPGRGMGLMFVLMGVLAILTALGGFAHPRLRNVECELPDMVEG